MGRSGAAHRILFPRASLLSPLQHAVACSRPVALFEEEEFLAIAAAQWIRQGEGILVTRAAANPGQRARVIPIDVDWLSTTSLVSAGGAAYSRLSTSEVSNPGNGDAHVPGKESFEGNRLPRLLRRPR